MKKEELYFDSRDTGGGAPKIHAVRYIPEEPPVCVLQIVHGMAEYAERYEGFARFLTDRGVLVVAEDHLGHGQSIAQDRPFGYFCEQDPVTVVVRDVHRLKKMTQQLYPTLPYFILGHSMGSFILRNYLTRYGSGIRGAVIMGTGFQPDGKLKASAVLVKLQTLFLGSRHVSRFCDKISFGSYNKRITNAKTPFDWLSADEENVQSYIEDPLCGNIFTLNGFRTLLELIRGAHNPEAMRKIPADLPLLLTAGREDPVGDYGEGVIKVQKLLQDAGVRRVDLKLWDGMRHEILNETDREDVMRYVYDWIMEQV